MEKYEKMSPKNTEDAPLKKTEKVKRCPMCGWKLTPTKEEEKIRKFYISNRELIEKLKKSLKKQPPGRVERL